MSTAHTTAFVLYNKDASAMREWQPGDDMVLVATAKFESAWQSDSGKRPDHDKLQTDIAEDLFREYNIGEARPSTLRSMSVGDAVMMRYTIEGVEFMAGLVCENTGWKHVPVRRFIPEEYRV